jgi:small subunit ribosomal protein S13
MARIAGVDLPREKRVEVGLTYIYGVGRSTARKICREAQVDPDTKVRDLAEGEVARVRTYIDQKETLGARSTRTSGDL